MLGSFRLDVGIRMSLRARYPWRVRPWWVRAVDAEGRGVLLGGYYSGIGGARLFDWGISRFRPAVDVAIGGQPFLDYYCFLK